MARYFTCPYLGGTVELNDEREEHILQKHVRVLSEGDDIIASTLESPDFIRRDARAPNTLLFTRWYDAWVGGKHAVVVVVSDPPQTERHWIVTAYIANRVPERDVVWRQS